MASELEAAPKTKGHIKVVIHRLFEKAMLWELVEWQRNPMELVEIKGISKRQKRPVILTVEQFFMVYRLIPQPYSMMTLLAICSGVRAEEVLAIEKPDIHFEQLSLQIFRAVVHGRVKFVKTEYSEDELPLDEIILSTDADELKKHAGSFDFILDTISAEHDINAYVQLLRRDGNLTMVGAPEKPLPLSVLGLLFGRKNVSGSFIGGIQETQEMLDFCGTHNITADVEVILIQQVNEAYERLLKSDVKYRFSIDMASLKSA